MSTLKIPKFFEVFLILLATILFTATILGTLIAQVTGKKGQRPSDIIGLTQSSLTK
jgi:hypothetical protein